MTTPISRIAQAVVLATGLGAASVSEGCPDAVEAAKGVPPSSAAQGATAGGLTPAGLYAVLHDVALNKQDGLSNYDDDYQAQFAK